MFTRSHTYKQASVRWRACDFWTDCQKEVCSKKIKISQHRNKLTTLQHLMTESHLHVVSTCCCTSSKFKKFFCCIIITAWLSCRIDEQSVDCLIAGACQINTSRAALSLSHQVFQRSWHSVTDLLNLVKSDVLEGSDPAKLPKTSKKAACRALHPGFFVFFAVFRGSDPPKLGFLRVWTLQNLVFTLFLTLQAL
jgi:hypothetical protein